MSENSGDVQAVEKLGEAREQLLAELQKTIVGMEQVIDEAVYWLSLPARRSGRAM